jgi:hypothetical protein
MSCCGGQRAALRQATRQTYRTPELSTGSVIDRNRPPSMELEFSGQGQLAITGPQTGIRYHFAARGSRVLVHAADVASLALVPGLSPAR